MLLTCVNLNYHLVSFHFVSREVLFVIVQILSLAWKEGLVEFRITIGTLIFWFCHSTVFGFHGFTEKLAINVTQNPLCIVIFILLYRFVVVSCCFYCGEPHLATVGEVQTTPTVLDGWVQYHSKWDHWSPWPYLMILYGLLMPGVKSRTSYMQGMCPTT